MKIEHIALYVKNLENAKYFFETYFGAKSNDGYRNDKTGLCTYFLTFRDGTRLEIMSRPEIEKVEIQDLEKTLFCQGLCHLAFSTGSKEEVDELTTRLSQDGYRVVSGPRMTGDGYYESLVLGIENVQIEITV